MRKVFLDANFLILPFQFNVDIWSELDRVIGEPYEVYTANRVFNEALNVEDGKYHGMVKRLVDESDVEFVEMPSERSVDDTLVEMAGQYIVCTNDRELRERLDEQSKPHIYLRQKNHLEAANLRNAAFF